MEVSGRLKNLRSQLCVNPVTTLLISCVLASAGPERATDSYTCRKRETSQSVSAIWKGFELEYMYPIVCAPLVTLELVHSLISSFLASYRPDDDGGMEITTELLKS
ncbi:hypothetical protein PoB_006090300 [Plakobranchus ocellatus]|uniref:Secreted protein n=1 Tax=Plakobranchus ocellatus TaxID=259542 RepID=A0AAV4CRA9_9GAST|nr:hypothetical protein PoB_006090300 [Plakobranchus ocellatus]